LSTDKYKFLKPHDLESMEFDLKETVLRDPLQIEYRSNRYHKQVQRSERAKDEKHYQNYMLYNDMVWK
jgi:hypothetical protein